MTGRGAPGAHRGGRVLGAVVLVCSVSMTALVHADDTHYQTFIVGDRAAGLGGAFTAISDDASGGLYNPAGIVDVRYESLQISASLYGFSISKVGQSDGLLGAVDDILSNLVIIPTVVGSVSTFGDVDAFDRKRNAWGFTVIVPTQTTEASSEQTPSSLFSRSYSDRELWTGLSYARRVSDDVSLGVSAYYILRQVSLSEETHTYHSALDAVGPTTYRLTQNHLEFISGALRIIGGLKWVPASGWSVGLSFMLPSIAVNSNGTLRSTHAAWDGAGSTFDTQLVQVAGEETGALENRLPFSVRAGVAYSRSHAFTLTADISMHGPILPYMRVPETLQRDVDITTHIERRPVVNFNIGGEWLFADDMSVAAGFYTDFSSAPSFPETGLSEDHLPHVDLFGFSAMYGIYSEHTLNRFGVIFSFGDGFDVQPGAGPVRFLPVAVQQRFLYFFLSSTFRF